MENEVTMTYKEFKDYVKSESWKEEHENKSAEKNCISKSNNKLKFKFILEEEKK